MKKETKPNLMTIDEIESEMTRLAKSLSEDSDMKKQMKLNAFKEVADLKTKRTALEKENEQTIFVQSSPLSKLLGIDDPAKNVKEEKIDANSGNQLN